MGVAAHDVDQLLDEHHALLRAYAEVQLRCSELVRRQATDIARLEAQAMRLHAQAIARTTLLAWAHEDRAELERSIPGLGRRVELARRVEALQARVHELMDALQRRELAAGAAIPPSAAVTAPDGDDARLEANVEAPIEASLEANVEARLEANLEADLAAADLVICQTGCISHGAYWRVRDHCKRTGKACVLVEDPAALRIVRIHDVEHGAPVLSGPERG